VKQNHLGIFIMSMMLLTACTSAVTEAVPAAEEPWETEAASATTPKTDECLACHTDKQRLIDTAKPEEPAETESKGVG
jgi:hypothetical protein